jgi:hypothetical protein
MKRSKKIVIAVMAVVVCAGTVFYACKKDTNVLPNEKNLPSFENGENMTKLGKQLKNPFSVENMKIAYSNLKSSNSGTPNLEIETTHLYIRFLPKDFDELDILKKDSTLILYEMPMDYEILEPGIYYHDPSLPDSAITWQYCAVEVNKVLPNLPYELLAKLYIPPVTDEDESEPSNNAEFYDLLEEEALRITGNLEDNDTGLKSRKAKKSWRPAGRITVWDDNMSNYMPIQGVEVRAKYWFTTHIGITNAQGYYSCNGTFKHDANYSIKWDRYNFSIRSGTVGQATYDGPKRKSDWYLNIDGGKSKYYATIFRAAYHYYYGDIKGLKRPPENSFWKPQMKIAAIYEVNNDANGLHAAWNRVFGICNWIKLYNPANQSQTIYGTTIHELAHASHWDMGHSEFNNTASKVKESWSRGVQWYLTRIVYPNYAGGSTDRPNYTQVVVDLIDSRSDEANHFNYGATFPDDQVTGYTMKEIEDALKGKESWESWRDNIKNKYNNATENQVDALFNYWN